MPLLPPSARWCLVSRNLSHRAGKAENICGRIVTLMRTSHYLIASVCA